jgi:hypothetical protein
VPSVVMEGAVLRPWCGMCAGRGQLGGGGGIDCIAPQGGERENLLLGQAAAVAWQ